METCSESNTPVGLDAEQDDAGAKRQKTAANVPSTFNFTQKSASSESDLVLKVEGFELYVTKNILAQASPVFCRMFQSGFKETSVGELELPGKRKRDMVEFLGCIYPNTVSEISCSCTALRILPLADEYQVSQLKRRCQKVLLDAATSKFASTELLCRFLGPACLYNLRQLRYKCVQLLSSRSQDQLEKASKKFPVPVEVLFEIFGNINATMKCKIDKLKASNDKIKKENETLKDYISVELIKMDDHTITQGLNWKEKLIVLNLSDDEVETRTTKRVDIWGKSLSVSAVLRKYYYSGEQMEDPWLHLEIDVQGEGSVLFCSIAIRCIFVSRDRRNQNMSFSFQEQMDDNNQMFERKLVKISEIRAINHVLYRKISPIVQILMSKPRRS